LAGSAEAHARQQEPVCRAGASVVSEWLARELDVPRHILPVDWPGGLVYSIVRMRIPLTRYGLPEVAAYPAGVGVVMAALVLWGPALLSGWAIVAAEGVLALVLVWALMFFRDPHREPPRDSGLWLAPADGKVVGIERVEEPDFIGGPALRISIFLSVFNTHINRSPCDAKVERITYRRGKFLNALNPLAGKINESNAIAMMRSDRSLDRNPKLVVRQISGAIARRIVCAVREGQQLAGGERFGMIKFGSRTELYIAADERVECAVRIGDKVKAGVTPLARYRMGTDGQQVPNGRP
jgi:phosphatidylserine decarboxylase